MKRFGSWKTWLLFVAMCAVWFGAGYRWGQRQGREMSLQQIREHVAAEWGKHEDRDLLPGLDLDKSR